MDLQLDLYLIRHPRPAVPAGLCYGSTDLALAAEEGEGSVAAARLRPLLPQDAPFLSSPLTRCRLLAQALALVVVLAFLMVSTFRYRSFKGVDLRRRRSYITLVGIALFFLLVASHPEGSVLALTSLYTVSGPLAWAASALRRRFHPGEPRAADEPQPAR